MFKNSLLESVKARLVHPELLPLPLHARIQRALRQLILDGALATGTPLPASRLLASSLGVSRDTIESAYGQLHAEGFIERRVGSGSFVAEATRLLPGRPAARRTRKTTEEGPGLSRRGQAMLRQGGVREHLAPRPFAHGVPETRTFPLQTWERLQRQALKEFGSKALLHGDPQGLEPLRRAIADYVNLERGARTTADQVLVLTSSQQGAGDGHGLHQRRRQHQVADAQSRKQRFGEGAYIERPLVRIQALDAGGRPAGVVEFAVVVVLDDPGLFPLGPFDQGQAPLQGKRRARRELV